jgi:predicted pyridoxine 5'-phosphate oxidase superfamily flavin-nucleotide-binding protein
MKIGVVGSMQYTEKMLAVRDKLISMGHDAFVTTFAQPLVGNDKILITDNYMNKSKQNLAKNNKVAVVAWSKDEEEGYQFKGTAQYLTEGKWKKFVEQMEENKGLSAKAAVLVTVKEIYRLA